MKDDYNAVYWDRRYTIRKAQIPVFLAHQADTILTTGTAFCRCVCLQEFLSCCADGVFPLCRQVPERDAAVWVADSVSRRGHHCVQSQRARLRQDREPSVPLRCRVAAEPSHGRREAAGPPVMFEELLSPPGERRGTDCVDVLLSTMRSC